MTRRIARHLASLYPHTWRNRYGDEFAVFLEGEAATVSTVINVIACACREHVRHAFEFTMTPARRVTLLMYACLAAMTAVVNLYWTIDDTPILDTMRAHGVIESSWAVIAYGSGAALVIAAAIAAPIVRNVRAGKVSSRRCGIIARLVVPFGLLALLVLWMSIVVARTHWAPMPWDITGDWRAPAEWPSTSARAVLGGVTSLLIVVGLGGSAIALRQAIERAVLSDSVYLHIVLGMLATTLVITAAAALGWGLLADFYAPEVFHSRAGGIFGGSMAVSWIVSLTLFVGASVVAVNGVRRRVPHVV